MFVIDNQKYKFNFEIQKSKFSVIIQKIDNKDSLKKFLNLYKDQNATHNCFAYKIGINHQVAGYDDNGEPSGTAGQQIFKIIEKNQLTNIVILVIRYYGGIKLGAAGLSRAYSKISNDSLKKINFWKLESAFNYKITFNFNQIKEIDNFLNKKKIKVDDKKYDQNVHYQFKSENQNLLKEISFKLLNLKITPILIEKSWPNL